MKLYSRYCILCLIFISIYSPTFAISNPLQSQQSLVYLQDSSFFFTKQILELTPKKYKQITGQRMKIGQRISLFFVKHKVRHQIKTGEPVNFQAANEEINSLKFHWGGFLLGLLLSIVGLLITYLIGDRRKIKSAWYGFALSGVILLLLILLRS